MVVDRGRVNSRSLRSMHFVRRAGKVVGEVAVSLVASCLDVVGGDHILQGVRAGGDREADGSVSGEGPGVKRSGGGGVAADNAAWERDRGAAALPVWLSGSAASVCRGEQ